jgi:hypothetical protein
VMTGSPVITSAAPRGEPARPGDVPMWTFISPCKTRLLAIAIPAADLLSGQAELAGLTSLLRGPGGGPWMCSAMPTREGRAAPRTGEPRPPGHRPIPGPSWPCDKAARYKCWLLPLASGSVAPGHQAS